MILLSKSINFRTNDHEFIYLFTNFITIKPKILELFTESFLSFPFPILQLKYVFLPGKEKKKKYIYIYIYICMYVCAFMGVSILSHEFIYNFQGYEMPSCIFMLIFYFFNSKNLLARAHYPSMHGWHPCSLIGKCNVAR